MRTDRNRLCAILSLVLTALSLALIAAEIGRPIYNLQPVPLADVNIIGDFWAPKMNTNRTVSIRHLFEKFGDRSYDNPRLIEAASYMVAKSHDAELAQTLERLVTNEIAATETRLKTPTRISGYFYEAAVAYYHATGDRRMLEEAAKAFNALDTSYGPGKKNYVSGHEGMKIGLLAMYRETAIRGMPSSPNSFWVSGAKMTIHGRANTPLIELTRRTISP